MAAYPIPLIHRQDYDAFRRLMGADLPHTYDEWLKLHGEYGTGLLKQGHNTRQIEVHLDEFSRFCRSRNVNANRKTLLDFAIEKAAGKNY
jgi:hypothetical protein